MSPEQACGSAVDYRSDQTSFGLILYELTTGKQAFNKRKTVETLLRYRSRRPTANSHQNNSTASLDHRMLLDQGTAPLLRIDA
jgi:hypothetical protein